MGRALRVDELEWMLSPAPGVLRKRLEHSGHPERGRVTSVVRYAPSSHFPAHAHPEGEELLVLDGVLEDERGRYTAGTWLLNPPGSTHAPRSEGGCTLFVKLRQYAGQDRARYEVNTGLRTWQPHRTPDVYLLPLYEHHRHPERSRMVRLEPGARFMLQVSTGGAELLVTHGELLNRDGRWPALSWMSLDPGEAVELRTRAGCALYLKEGHRGA